MKLLFGSIIVKGAGRINGHVVRNYRGMPLLTRLALPTRTNIFNNNPQFAISTLAFKYWGNLNAENKGAWNSISAEIPFSDRWGNTKYLSGREFTSYLYINCANIGKNVTNPGDFISTFPSFTASDVNIKTSTPAFDVGGFSPSDGNFQLIYMKLCLNDNRSYNEKQLKLITFDDLLASDPTAVYTKIVNAGITFSVGQRWAVGIKNISDSGLASPMQIFYTTIEE